MKNKLENESSGEKITEKLSKDYVKLSPPEVERPCYRINTSAPRIVVCPPMEDVEASAVSQCGECGESGRDGRDGRDGRGRPARRQCRRAGDANSLKSASSSDSEGRSEDNSCSTSDSSSDGSDHPRRHRSTVSLKRLFQSLNLTSRSQSSSPSDRPPQSKKPQPKCLLRSPVAYTYVRGPSGLPTQRVPRHVAYQYVT